MWAMSKVRACLLNIDLGELSPSEEPSQLYAAAQLANVACGGHAGVDESMRRALQLCLSSGTAPGAHPSFPDRAGFGRRPLAAYASLGARAVFDAVAEPCARLATIAAELGATLGHMKPHGTLYHAADADPELAQA